MQAGGRAGYGDKQGEIGYDERCGDGPQNREIEGFQTDVATGGKENQRENSGTGEQRQAIQDSGYEAPPQRGRTN